MNIQNSTRLFKQEPLVQPNNKKYEFNGTNATIMMVKVWSKDYFKKKVKEEFILSFISILI
jgi:hypothetical protein